MSVWIPDETMLSKAELEVQIQQIRSIYIKIEILNTDDLVIDEVSGECIGGSYNINAEAPIRRTCSVKFKIFDKFLPSEKSVFWINKRFRLFVGITYLKTGEIIWFKKGTYAIQDPSVNISINENSVSISGLDKMALFTGDISGQLSVKYIIKPSEGNSGVYVHDAIKAVVKDGGESNMKISETSLIIPYKIEKNIGETRYGIINELVNLFYNYQAFYDLDGNFIFTEKPTELGAIKNSEVQWDFSSYNLIQSLERQIQYKNIKNKFTVYGGVMSKGCQAQYQILLTDKEYPDCPYTQTRLLENFTRDFVVQEDTYIGSSEAYDKAKATGKIDEDIDDMNISIEFESKFTQKELEDMKKSLKYATQLCKNRAKQEIFYHQQATDTVKITCLPIYSLDVNQVIEIYDKTSGTNGKYVVKEISCGLSSKDIMNITAIKLW